MKPKTIARDSLRKTEEKRLLGDINRLGEEIRERSQLREAKIRMLRTLRTNADPAVEGEGD